MTHGFYYSFYIELYEIVNDPSLDPIISWSKTCDTSFVIWDVDEFRRRILPKFHRSFSVFVLQLRYHHSFKRIGRFEFRHENFVKGQPRLLERMVPTIVWNNKLREKLRAKRDKAKAKKVRAKVVSLLQNLQI